MSLVKKDFEMLRLMTTDEISLVSGGSRGAESPACAAHDVSIAVSCTYGSAADCTAATAASDADGCPGGEGGEGGEGG
jgi:hypothetical protein